MTNATKTFKTKATIGEAFRAKEIENRPMSC